MKVIFLAGAYLGQDFNETEENIRLAEKYAIKLWEMGYGVFCPHLNTAHFELKAKVKEDAYKEFDMKILRACDVVFALPNWQESEGARTEINEAKRLGLPIYYSLEEIATSLTP